MRGKPIFVVVQTSNRVAHVVVKNTLSLEIDPQDLTRRFSELGY